MKAYFFYAFLCFSYGCYTYATMMYTQWNNSDNTIYAISGFPVNLYCPETCQWISSSGRGLDKGNNISIFAESLLNGHYECVEVKKNQPIVKHCNVTVTVFEFWDLFKMPAIGFGKHVYIPHATHPLLELQTGPGLKTQPSNRGFLLFPSMDCSHEGTYNLSLFDQSLVIYSLKCHDERRFMVGNMIERMFQIHSVYNKTGEDGTLITCVFISLIHSENVKIRQQLCKPHLDTEININEQDQGIRKKPLEMYVKCNSQFGYTELHPEVELSVSSIDTNQVLAYASNSTHQTLSSQSASLHHQLDVNQEVMYSCSRECEDSKFVYAEQNVSSIEINEFLTSGYISARVTLELKVSCTSGIDDLVDSFSKSSDLEVSWQHSCWRAFGSNGKCDVTCYLHSNGSYEGVLYTKEENEEISKVIEWENVHKENGDLLTFRSHIVGKNIGRHYYICTAVKKLHAKSILEKSVIMAETKRLDKDYVTFVESVDSENKIIRNLKFIHWNAKTHQTSSRSTFWNYQSNIYLKCQVMEFPEFGQITILDQTPSCIRKCIQKPHENHSMSVICKAIYNKICPVWKYTCLVLNKNREILASKAILQT